LDFLLFLLVAAVLFIRPSDFVPGLEQVPLYQLTIFPCILLSWHKLVPQLRGDGLRNRPVFVFGAGIVAVCVATTVLHGQVESAVDFAMEVSKVLIFYLLLLAQLDSPRRLRLFLGCLAGIILVPITLAVLNFHGYVTIPSFKITDDGGFRRMGGSGNFADPNDACEIINCAIFMSLCRLLDRGGGLGRILWLGPLAVFGYALSLTQSRGGLLGAMVGLLVLFRSRFRGIKSLVLIGAAVGLLYVVAGRGRQTTLDTSEGTSQARIQLWDAGFELLKRSPLIGVGLGGFGGNVNHVAHNAFIQTYAELGLLGGTLFFGQYFYCLANLMKLGSKRVTLPDPELRRLHPFLFAALAGFAASEMSVTNPYALITYTMFGLATAFFHLADLDPPPPNLVLSGTLVRRVILFAGLFLAGLYAFVRMNLRYG
jgi:O-antigen ligase